MTSTTTNTTTERGPYNEIVKSSIPADTRRELESLMLDIANADKVDEHGGWDFGIQQLTRRRSRALNWDVYGIGRDVHSGQMVAVIQVREWTEGRRFNTVRKSYFLVGRNEDGSAFAHPVSHAPIHAAIRAERDVCEAVQDWIFGGRYRDMIRHGDLAIIPMKTRPAGTKGQLRRVATLEDSHRLEARQIAEVDGRIYARDPQISHIPGTHPDVSAAGWCRIIVGRRAQFWNFAVPTID